MRARSWGGVRRLRRRRRYGWRSGLGAEVMSLPCHPILCPKVGRGQVVAVTKLVILLVIPPAITGHVRNALDGRAC
jgi:hypothetical protein